jgi:hypothetical protein
VGWFETDTGSGGPLVEHWVGGIWSMMGSTPKAAGSLSAVDCPGKASCFAVGGGLIEHWNGRGWHPMSHPQPPSGSVLSGISCPAATSCFAVGARRPGQHSLTLVLHWNGRTWSIEGSPNLANRQYLGLRAVSCPSASSCFAVGSDFIEDWNGHAWSVMPTGGNGGTVLNAVHCMTLRSCIAVGSTYIPSDGSTGPEANYWNGSEWREMRVPRVSSSINTTTLNGIDCPNTTSCFAVGSYYTDTGSTRSSIIEHWNGNSWSIMPSPHVFPLSELQSASCWAPHGCIAVGDFYVEGENHLPVFKTLAERYR